MRLTDGLLTLWRRDGESQLGSDPRLAVVLDRLSGPQQRALDVLARDPVASCVELARASHGSVRESRELVRRLTRAGVLLDPPRSVATWAASQRAAEPERERAARAARVRRLAGLAGRAGQAGSAALLGSSGALPSSAQRRQLAGVVVLGADPLGLTVARLLTAAGVGTVAPMDRAPVLGGDVSAFGFHVSDVGQPREVAAVAHLRHSRPDVRTGPPARPDVAVLVESRVSVPFRSSALLGDDVPHLSLVQRELDVVVGPAVRPGRDACLRCLDLHRRDADPCWPAVATQLAVAPPTAHDAATVVTAAGLACSAVLAMLDEMDDARGDRDAADDDPGPRAPWQRTREVGDGRVAERRWAPHPECGCGAQGAVRG